VTELSIDQIPAAPPESEEDLALRSNKLGWWILKWRLPLILASLLLTLVAAYGMRYLTFNPDTRAYFGPTNPERVALDNVEAKYAQMTNAFVVLAPRDGNVFSASFLEALGEFTTESWQVPYATRVDSMSNFRELKADGEDLRVTPLVDPKVPMTAEYAADVRRRALATKDLIGNLVSAKGDVTGVAIMITRPDKSGDEIRLITEHIRAMAQRMRKAHPEIEVRLTGGVMAADAFVEAAKRDTIWLMPAMAAIILLTLLVGMRSVTVAMVTSVVIAFTVAMTMGIYGWGGTILNTVTAAAPPIIMTLFFADCVHFVMAAVQQQTHGRTREQSIAEAVRLNLLPILIKTATTVVGFLALNFSDSPPINQLGNVVAVGSLIGCLLTITLIPTLLSYLPLPKYSEDMRVHRFLAGMADWIVVRNRWFLYAFVVVLPLALLLIPTIKVDDNFVHYFDESFQFRQDTDFLEQRLTGMHRIIYSVPSGRPEGITDPAYLRKLDAFAEWYRAQPNVAHVSSLADVVRRLNKAMNEDDPAFDRIPDDKKLIAQYLFLYELSLPQGKDMSSLVDVGRAESLFTVDLARVSSNDIINLADGGRAWLQQNATAHSAQPTGMSLVYSHLTARNIQAMFMGTLVSVLLVSLIMAVALRNRRLGLISLFINLAPAAIAFGAWALTGSEVNLAISFVTAITYGIVTDDTVHTMTKYRWARRVLKKSPADAARETLTYTGSAVILSSVALAAGFALLGFSSFNITAVMGILTALIVAIAALAELLLLPGILIMFDREKS
jgi:predicted RND superfamily exporter protein